MTRSLALLVVTMLTVPTVAPLVCDWTCGRQQTAAAASAGACHDHGGPESTAPAMTGAHTCHDIGMLPTSILRDAAPLALPAITRAMDVSAGGRAGAVVFAPLARLTAHAPPPLALPLRI